MRVYKKDVGGDREGRLRGRERGRGGFTKAPLVPSPMHSANSHGPWVPLPEAPAASQHAPPGSRPYH